MALEETTHTSVKKITWTWTSDGSGNASETTSHAYDGECLLLVTVPGTSAEQPDDLYDLTVDDADGIDVLAGAGGDRSNSDTERVQGSSLGVAVGKLTFSIENAGSSNTGTAYLYIR